MTDYASCPTCGQYSHSIGEDKLADAFKHFQSMFSHRGDGIPTQHSFDARTRDAAQVLMAAARTPAPANALDLEANQAKALRNLEKTGLRITPAPASADAMEAWHSARRAFSAAGYSDGCIQLDHDTLNQAAARIIQQYGDQREAAGFRRGVEAAAKVADYQATISGCTERRTARLGLRRKAYFTEIGREVKAAILALLETQEAG